MLIKSYTKNISHLILTEPHEIGNNITLTWQAVFSKYGQNYNSHSQMLFYNVTLPKFPSTAWALYTLTLAFLKNI